MNLHQKTFSIITFSLALVTFFWWPLSHWLYSDIYHSLLGFSPGSYQESMVRMIGTCGILPVMVLMYLAFYPEKKWPLVFMFSIFSFLLGLTFMYLVCQRTFPSREYFNVFFSIGISIMFPYLYFLSDNT